MTRVAEACLEFLVKLFHIVAAKGVMSKLVCKAQRHLGVLQHMIERQILNKILSSVNLLVAVFEGRLNDERGGVASFGSGGMVRAGIAALGLDPRDVAVLVFVSLKPFVPFILFYLRLQQRS